MTTPAHPGRVPDPIFVSHSHLDNEWCRAFVATLTSAGWDVWYDEKGLHGGAEWLNVIQTELSARPNFMPILTPDAWASRWVQREMQLAMLEGKGILPVLHKDTPQISGFLKLNQWIDVIGSPAPVAAAKVAQEMGYPLNRPAPSQPQSNIPTVISTTPATQATVASPIVARPAASASLQGDHITKRAIDLDHAARTNGDEVRQPNGSARPQSSASRRPTKPIPPQQLPPPSPLPGAGETLSPSAGRAPRAGEWSASDFDSHELESWEHHDDAPFELPESPDDTYERTIQEARKAHERRGAGRRPSRRLTWDVAEDDIEWDDSWDDGWQNSQWDTGQSIDKRAVANSNDELSQSLAELARLSAVGAPLSRLARVRMLFRRRPTAAAMLAIVILGAIIIVGGSLFGIIGVKTGIIAQPVPILILIVVVIAGLAAVISLTVLIRTGYGPFLRKLI